MRPQTGMGVNAVYKSDLPGRANRTGTTSEIPSPVSRQRRERSGHLVTYVAPAQYRNLRRSGCWDLSARPARSGGKATGRPLELEYSMARARRCTPTIDSAQRHSNVSHRTQYQLRLCITSHFVALDSPMESGSASRRSRQTLRTAPAGLRDRRQSWCRAGRSNCGSCPDRARLPEPTNRHSGTAYH